MTELRNCYAKQKSTPLGQLISLAFTCLLHLPPPRDPFPLRECDNFNRDTAAERSYIVWTEQRELQGQFSSAAAAAAQHMGDGMWWKQILKK